MQLFGIVVCMASVVLAQVGPQAAQIPPCVKACDPAAIASVNCTNADQRCHCVRQDGILANITACADVACVNPSADIYIFTTLFADVCSKFNISVPIVGSNASTNGTNVTYPLPTPSVTPYTGGTARMLGTNIESLTVVALMLVADVAFGCL